MTNRIQTKEVTEHLQSLIKTNLEVSMGLKYEQIGAMEFYPSGQLSIVCPIVFIRPIKIDTAFSDIHINCDVAYTIRIVYVFQGAEGEDPVLKKIEEVDNILELLFTKFLLPDLTLTDAQVILTIPEMIEYEPYENDLFMEGDSNLQAAAITFRIETMVV